MLRPLQLSPFVFLVLVASSACSESDPTPSSPVFDASPIDSKPDAIVDAPFDASDGSKDVIDDLSQDGGGDAFPDVLIDSPEDAPFDVSSDVDAGDVWAELGPGVWVNPARPVAGDILQIRYEGSLASATSVVVHHGFNGWNEVAGTGAIEQDDGTGNLDFFLELPLTPDGGRHVGQMTVPDGVRSIHMVFRGKQGTQDVWDNQDRRDYNLGVQFPYLGPFLTWESSPSEEIIVHFHTGMRCEGFVQVGESSPTSKGPPNVRLVQDVVDPPGWQGARRAHAGACNRRATQPAGMQRRRIGPVFRLEAPKQVGGLGFMHHVVLSDLTPDTEYSYRVGCEGLPASETFKFRTAPSSTSDLTFAVAADAQDNGETGRWAEVASAIRAQNPSLVVISGDLAWNDKPGLWWTFFDKGRALLAERPLVAVPGNHDTPGVGSHPDTSTFRWLFDLDDTPGHTRSLRWGPATFLLLSSETSEDFVMGTGAQYQWVQQQMPGLSGRPWVFAAWHIGPYNAGSRHTGSQGAFRDITQLFDGTVDWVFSGHEHLYQRMKPLRYNGVLAPSAEYGRGSQDGVGYLIAPPAGAWPAENIVAWDDPKSHYRDRLAYPVPTFQQNNISSEQGFVIIDLQGKQLSLRTYGLGTTIAPAALHLVDQVSYTKP